MMALTASKSLGLARNTRAAAARAGSYGFLVAAIDGDLNGGGGADRFGIKIWDASNADALVYDNKR